MGLILDSTAAVAAERQGRGANDGERARFRSHDGKRQSPGGNVPAPEEVGVERTLPFAETDAEQSDRGQVTQNDDKVQPVETQ